MKNFIITKAKHSKHCSATALLARIGEIYPCSHVNLPLMQVWDRELETRPIADNPGITKKLRAVSALVGPAHWATIHMRGLRAGG